MCAGFMACFPLQLVLYTEELQAQLPSVLTNQPWVSDNRRGKACINAKAVSYSLYSFWYAGMFLGSLGTQI